MLPQPWLALAIALGIGLLVGAERERRKGDGPRRAAAGIRTFATVALLGAVSLLAGGEPLLAVSAAGVAAFATAAYWRNREEDPGITTEVALVLTLLLGALALREPALAAGLGVSLAALLAARTRLHHFVRTVLTESELNHALVLAAASLVVLPLLPDRYLGPFAAINPRTTWTIVILILSVSALGHVARRLLGSRLGLPAAGLASGFVSSVATIAAMGAQARRAPELLRPAVAGAALSTFATFVQMAAVLAVASPQTLARMAVALLCGGAAALAYGALLTLRTMRAEVTERDVPGDAFSLRAALALAATISLVLVLAAALEAWLGEAGVVAATALAGFADAHSAAVSAAALVASGKLDADGAAIPVLVALSTNTLTKAAAAVGTGERRFAAQVIPGLALAIAAAWIGAAAFG